MRPDHLPFAFTCLLITLPWVCYVQASTGLTAGSLVELSYDSKCREENTIDIEVCGKFSIGDENQGFIYSPNYPNNYPNSTECARCIEAPHGRFIKLEFRDHFNMEESTSCEYDKLEIRNGKFGYSDLLATLCGHEFPNEISSSDRFLWLRFKSDESIEYSGFKIYYQFIPLASPKPLPPKDCSEDIRGRSSGIISHEHISKENIQYSMANNAPLECVWTIEVEPKNKMYINFLIYTLEKPNDCDMNYIDIYEENFNEEKRKQRFCGTSTEPFKSDSNKVRIRFHAKPGALKAKFSLLYTSFREVRNKEKCDANNEFDCNDGTCIDIRLKCNAEDNCKYRYDEDKSLCMPAGSGLSTLMDNHMIVILVVFFALVIGMCASIVVSCWGKIQERRQREMDYKMRVSSHPSLDAIDRMNLVIGASGSKQLQAAAAAAAAGMMGAGAGAGGHLPAAATQLLRNAKNASLLQQQQQQSHQLLLLGSRNNSEEMDDQMMDEEDEEGQDDEMMMMEEDELEEEEEVDQDELDDEDEEDEDEDATAACYINELGEPIRADSGMLILDKNGYSARLAQQHSVESNQSADLISPSDSCPLFYQHASSRNASGTCNPLLYSHQSHHRLLHPLQMIPTDSSIHSNASNGSESPIPPPPPPPAVAHLRSCPVRTGTPISMTGSSCGLAGPSGMMGTGSATALSLDVSKLPHAGSLVHLNAASSHPHLFHAVNQMTQDTPPAPPPPQSSVLLSRHLSQRQLQPLTGSLLHCAHAPPLRQTIGSLTSGSLDSEQPVSEPAPGSKQMLLR